VEKLLGQSRAGDPARTKGAGRDENESIQTLQPTKQNLDYMHNKNNKYFRDKVIIHLSQ